ncbi:unnamed protein product, partial [Prorocentrum cordatum]
RARGGAGGPAGALQVHGALRGARRLGPRQSGGDVRAGGLPGLGPRRVLLLRGAAVRRRLRRGEAGHGGVAPAHLRRAGHAWLRRVRAAHAPGAGGGAGRPPALRRRMQRRGRGGGRRFGGRGGYGAG